MGKALEILEKLWKKDFGDPIDVTYNEFIEAMNELRSTKTCNNCKFFDAVYYGGDCTNFGFSCTSDGFETHLPDDGFCCNRYEPKR